MTSISGEEYEARRYGDLAAETDLLLMILCPKCGSGSDETALRAQAVGGWGEVLCRRCQKHFLVAHAIDEMFIDGFAWGYVLWLNCKRLTKFVRCAPGEVKYLLLPDEFEEVYRVITSYFDGMHALAGGVVVEYTIPGMLVAAVAGGESDNLPPLKMCITLVGRAKGSPPPPAWKRLVLEARLAAFKAPALTPIHAVSAIDLFIEELTGKPAADGRPGSWSTAVKSALGMSLVDLIGKRPFQNLERLVQIRNQLAHGTEYIKCLPESLRAEESKWQTDPQYRIGEAAIRPSCELALRSALTVIRSCRHRVAKLNGST